MNLSTGIESDLASLLKEAHLPRAVETQYDTLECLADRNGTQTYLVQHRETGALSIAKCFDRNVYPEVNVAKILKGLHHEGLPACTNEYRDDDTVCVVREYIDGLSLDRYIAEQQPSREARLALFLRLCDILGYLHQQNPPIIHRDIKPQNVIVRPDGSAALIDFDAVRVYDSASTTDTQFIGTRLYAPPEQYGFAQTDPRTDVYSMGVLLCWLLTGTTDLQNAAIRDKALWHVVKRCTSFAPDARYPNALAVKHALHRAQKKRALPRILTVAAIGLCCLCVGFVIGRYTDVLVQTPAVHFEEPLIEQAVRVQLGKSATDPITVEELSMVQELYIFGNEVSVDITPFANGLSGERGKSPRGTIVSLEDLRQLPYLKVLLINYQLLSDISPVASLQYLTDVSFCHTYVSDITPLASLPNLKNVGLYDTAITDATCLNACPLLYMIDVGQTNIRSIDALPLESHLEMLSLKRLKFSSLEGLQKLPQLEQLMLNGATIDDLSVLHQIPSLKSLHCDSSMKETVDALGTTAFEVEYE